MLELPLPDTQTFSGDELAAELDLDGYVGVRVWQHHPADGPPVLHIEGTTQAGADIDGRSKPRITGLLTAHQARRANRGNLAAKARAAKSVPELSALVAELAEGRR